MNYAILNIYIYVCMYIYIYIYIYSRASLLCAPLLCGFGYNAVGRGPRFSAARGKSQMEQLKPT